MKKNITIIIGIVIVAGVAFYGGMKYDQGQVATSIAVHSQQFGGGNGGRGGGGNGGFTNGDIISRDDKSITVNLRGGGSRIIFVSGSTQVMKSVQGTLSDLSVGQSVVAMGSTNTDGSLSADSVQIRPSMGTSTPGDKIKPAHY